MVEYNAILFPPCVPRLFLGSQSSRYSRSVSCGLVQMSGFLEADDETAWPSDTVSGLQCQDCASLPDSLLFQEPWRTRVRMPARVSGSRVQPGCLSMALPSRVLSQLVVWLLPHSTATMFQQTTFPTWQIRSLAKSTPQCGICSPAVCLSMTVT